MNIHGINITIRQALVSDLPYIVSTWVKSAAEYRPRGMEKSVYEIMIRQAALNSLDNGGVLVADADGAIVGWCSHDSCTNVLHYTYVPYKLRGVGIGNYLISQTALIEPYYKSFDGLRSKGIYNPYTLPIRSTHVSKTESDSRGEILESRGEIFPT